MTTAQIDAFLAEIGYIPFQPFEDLPTQVCSHCKKPKLRGLQERDKTIAGKFKFSRRFVLSTQRIVKYSVAGKRSKP